MAGTEDNSGTEASQKLFNSIVDVLLSPVQKKILGIDAAHEGDLTPVFSCKFSGRHTPCRSLHRVKTIQSRINEIGYDIGNTSAAVQYKLKIVAVGLVRKLFNPGHEEFVEQLRRYHESVLRTEIVADKKRINLACEAFKEQVISFKVKITDKFSRLPDDFGVGVQLYHKFFGTEEIRQVMVERRPEPAQNKMTGIFFKSR